MVGLVHEAVLHGANIQVECRPATFSHIIERSIDPSRLKEVTVMGG